MELLEDLLAHSGNVGWVRGINVREIAVVSSVSIVKTVADKTVVVGHVEESGVAIVFPVGHTVADHEAAEVGLPVSGLGIRDVSVKA